jgi:hypothetical protein
MKKLSVSLMAFTLLALPALILGGCSRVTQSVTDTSAGTTPLVSASPISYMDQYNQGKLLDANDSVNFMYYSSTPASANFQWTADLGTFSNATLKSPVYSANGAAGTHHLRVVMQNGAQQTVQDLAIDFLPIDTVAPAVPVISQRNVGNVVNVDWSAVADADLDFYLLESCKELWVGGPSTCGWYRIDKTSTTAELSNTASLWKVMGSTNTYTSGINYTMALRARDKVGNYSGYSNRISYTQP